MIKTRSTILVAALAFILAGGSALIYAQQGAPAPAPGGGGPGGGGNFGGGGNNPQDRAARMAEFRQRMADALKQALGASDDEWKVLQPRIEKVQNLQTQALQGRASGMMGLMGGGQGGQGGPGGGGRRGNRGGPGGGNADPAQPQSEIATATAELTKLLADPSATSDMIKTKLAAVRAARKKAADELAKAQQELRDVLNLKQEAQMVAMGMLD